MSKSKACALGPAHAVILNTYSDGSKSLHLVGSGISAYFTEPQLRELLAFLRDEFPQEESQ